MINIFFSILSLLKEDETLHDINEAKVANSTPFRPIENKSNTFEQPTVVLAAVKGPNTSAQASDKENVKAGGPSNSSI